MLRKLICRLKRNSHGASLIEFAVILPILLALVMGIVEFGWIYTGYITITGAAREGVRLAARGEDPGEISTRVNNHSQFIINAGGSVNVVDITEDADVGGEITVELSGTLPLLIFGGRDYTVIRFPRLPDPFPLSSKATMRREY